MRVVSEIISAFLDEIGWRRDNARASIGMRVFSVTTFGLAIGFFFAAIGAAALRLLTRRASTTQSAQ